MQDKITNFREFSIAKYRKEKKISQEALAELIFMSRSSISNIEVNGCTDINLIAKLSEHLDFKIEIENGNIVITNKINVRDKENDCIMNNKKTIKEKILGIYKKDYIEHLKSLIDIDALYSKVDKDTIKESSYDDVINELGAIDETMEIKIEGTLMQINLECSLYESDEYYMIAFIGFDSKKDMHLNSYLTVYSKETLDEVEIMVDDIWEFRDWEEVLINR